MIPETTAGKRAYAGLFVVALATLMYEILLTRIFSVTMWYHYSFMAVSIAMFGLTVGAIVVYLMPGRFTPAGAKRSLAWSSLLFAATTVLCFLIHMRIPFVIEGETPEWPWLALTYSVVSVPFIFSGIAVSVALTKFPWQIGRLYAADLAGAALGCIALVYTLDLTDGPTAVFVVGAAAAAGALLFASEASLKAAGGIAVALCVALGAFAAVNTVMISKGRPLIRLVWVKGAEESPASYERWNSFSRIRVWGSVRRMERPFGWGMSPVYPTDRRVRQLHMNIDAGAYTVIPEFDGNVGGVGYLKYDVTNIAHYIRPSSDVLVVGAGGGRDVLAALAFDQSSVTAVEINEDILETVNEKFGRFTGHLDRHPKVNFVVGEARSYVAGGDEKYDIIQVSLIDTWAATAAGAFVLAENSLYTVEAWEVFLRHLKPGGALTFSRWYYRDSPAEMYRLTSLAAASLDRLGVETPRDHIVIVRSLWRGRMRNIPHGVGTILVSPQPFSEDDVDSLREIVRALRFDMVLSPESALDSKFAAIASAEDRAELARRFPFDISPPTDDRPFFFNMMRLGDVFGDDEPPENAVRFNMKAVSVLGHLLLIVMGLTALCIVVPLALTAHKEALASAAPLFIFFIAIGLGFMFVEISQMQRLIVFLGHPTYGLSVVLFSLLLSSGLGSYTTRGIKPGERAAGAVLRLALMLCALIAFGLLAPRAVGSLSAAGTPARIALAVAMLFPIGLFMGMAFPLGMKLAAGRSPAVTPWLWGLNGAASVNASVLAVAVALAAGISASFWCGVGCYALGVASFLWARRIG